MDNKKTNAIDEIRHAINIIQTQSQSIKTDETLAVLSMLNRESQRIIEIAEKLTVPKTKVKTNTVYVPAAKKVSKPNPVKQPAGQPTDKAAPKFSNKPIPPLKNKLPV